MSGDVISLTDEGTPFTEFNHVNFGEFPSISYHVIRPERAGVMSDYYREHWNENAVFDPLIAIHNAVLSLAERTRKPIDKMDFVAFESWCKIVFGCRVGASALFATYKARHSQLNQTPAQRLAGFIAANAQDPLTGWRGRPQPNKSLFWLIEPGATGVGSRLSTQIEWLRNYSKVPPDLSNISWLGRNNDFEGIKTRLEISLSGRQDVLGVLSSAFKPTSCIRFLCILLQLSLALVIDRQKQTSFRNNWPKVSRND